ncbi:hypothetical protein SY88_01540 [Clostridiales bacterium PH28_bin88]|nr:hypothetical protein SY88_01540 [Clostridiales bacterium PH28_bin88]
MDLLIRNGVLVSGGRMQQADLAVAGSRVKDIGRRLRPGKGTRVLDAAGRYVLPGIIDAHTHYRLHTRGTVTAEDFFTGTRAAACGGVTTVIDFADQVPGFTLAEAARWRMADAAGACVDFGLHMVVTRVTPGLELELAQLVAMGIPSVKVFTTYRQAGYMLEEEDITRLLVMARAVGALVTVHAEDNGVVEESEARMRREGKTAPGDHGLSRPAAAEARAIRRVIELARREEAQVYFVHVSTAEGCRAIREAREAGQPVWGETCPHYLLLNEDEYRYEEPHRFIMTPPLRTATDQAALWEGLGDGVLQVVATDHCAFSLEQKGEAQTCFDTLPGVPGTETLLPLVYSYGPAMGRFSLPAMVDLLSTMPAKIFGLYPRKGDLQVGSDADVVVFNPEAPRELRARALHSAAGYTPFEGMTVRGYPEVTILRGKVIYEHGRFCGQEGDGRFIRGCV